MVELSVERPEADVGSQSADTIKFGFSSCSNLWKQSLRTRKASKPAAVGGLFFISQQQYVAYWHETDMPTALRNVRSQGQSGKYMLAWSFSGFEPSATSA